MTLCNPSAHRSCPLVGIMRHTQSCLCSCVWRIALCSASWFDITILCHSAKPCLPIDKVSVFSNLCSLTNLSHFRIQELVRYDLVRTTSAWNRCWCAIPLHICGLCGDLLDQTSWSRVYTPWIRLCDTRCRNVLLGFLSDEQLANISSLLS